MTNPAPIRPSPRVPYSFPPRPERRPGPPRFPTLCFWTVLLLFVSFMALLGRLAYTLNAEEPDIVIDGHAMLGLLPAAFAAAIIVATTSRQRPR